MQAAVGICGKQKYPICFGNPEPKSTSRILLQLVYVHWKFHFQPFKPRVIWVVIVCNICALLLNLLLLIACIVEKEPTTCVLHEQYRWSCLGKRSMAAVSCLLSQELQCRCCIRRQHFHSSFHIHFFYIIWEHTFSSRVSYRLYQPFFLHFVQLFQMTGRYLAILVKITRMKLRINILQHVAVIEAPQACQALFLGGLLSGR